jgi:hypothetical protein
MFDSKQTLTERLTDAMDLAIDFATLGEYGLEPVGRTPQGCDGDVRVRNAADARRDHLQGIYSLSCGPRPVRARSRGTRDASLAVSAGGAA